MRTPRPGPGKGWREAISSSKPSMRATRRTSSLCQSQFVSIISPRSLAPVSYTHLDVYKRQLKRELEARQAEHEKELESLKGDLEKSRIEHENELLSLKRNFERKEAERAEEFVSLAYRMTNRRV